MAISGTPPAGGGSPPKASGGPDMAEKAKQRSESKAKQEWVRNLDHAQRGMKKLIERLRHEMAADDAQISIRAGLHDEPVIVVTDKYTGEVVREIPPAEIRKIASSLEQLRGLFLNQMG
jgi:uncharacterized FlaG/YvyC family protein